MQLAQSRLTEFVAIFTGLRCLWLHTYHKRYVTEDLEVEDIPWIFEKLYDSNRAGDDVIELGSWHRV